MREQWEDPLATRPNEKNEPSQTNQGLRECAWELYPVSNQALARPPRAPRGEAPAGSPKLGKYDNEESYGKVQGSAGEGPHDICGMPGDFARRHDGKPRVEGNHEQEPGVA